MFWKGAVAVAVFFLNRTDKMWIWLWGHRHLWCILSTSRVTRLQKFVNVGLTCSVRRFPKDEERRQAWTLAVRGEGYVASSRSMVCSCHFRPEDFDRTGQTVRIRDAAVPSIFKFSEHIPKVNHDNSIMYQPTCYNNTLSNSNSSHILFSSQNVLHQVRPQRPVNSVQRHSHTRQQNGHLQWVSLPVTNYCIDLVKNQWRQPHDLGAVCCFAVLSNWLKCNKSFLLAETTQQ